MAKKKSGKKARRKDRESFSPEAGFGISEDAPPDSPDSGRRDRLRRLALLAPLLILVVALSSGYIWNEDFWWYLSSGQSILDHGGIPDTDPFLYSSVHSIGWVYHSWLWTVLVAFLFRLGELHAVVAWHVLVAAGCAILVYTIARTDRFGIANALAVLFFLVAVKHRVSGKAEMATWLLLAVFVHVLETDRAWTWRRGLVLVSLQLLWANLHGGYPLGIFAVLCYALARGFDVRFRGRTNATGPPLWFPAVLFLVSIADPRMWRERLAPFGFVTGSTSVQPVGESGTMLILEWRSPFEIAGQDPTYAILYLIAVAVGLWSFSRARAVSVSRLLLFLGMAALGATAIRHVAGLCLVSALVVLLNVAERKPAPSRRRPRRRLAIVSAVALGALVIVAASSVWIARGGFEAGQSTTSAVVRPAIACPGAADFILDRRLPGPVFNDYQLGAYLGYRLQGHQQVFVDSRVMDPEVVVAYTEMVQSAARWKAAERRYGFRTAVLGQFSRTVRSPLGRALVDDPHWTLAYLDSLAAVFVKDARMPVRVPPFEACPFVDPPGYNRFTAFFQRPFLNDFPRNYLVELLGNLGFLGRLTDVVELSSKALNGSSADQPLVLARRCAALLGLGRSTEAVEDCEHAHEARSADDQITILLARSLKQAGQREQAIRLLDRSLSRDPRNRRLSEALHELQ